MTEKMLYEPKFALLVGGHISTEWITESELFHEVESFYEEGFDDWTIQAWDTSISPPQWVDLQ